MPIFYGLQLERWEFVLGTSLSERRTFSRLAQSGVLPPTSTVRVGFTLGAFRRAPASWGLQVGYLTDPDRFSNGTIQVQFGWFFDLG